MTDTEPKVVEAALQAGTAIGDDVMHAYEFPDGSKILVGPIRQVFDDLHGPCLQVQYQATEADSQASREVHAFKERGDRELHALAMRMHGDLLRIRSEAPEVFRSITTPTITVCSECLRASCWQGQFMCQQADHAGTVKKTRRELEELALEHPDYWELG